MKTKNDNTFGLFCVVVNGFLLEKNVRNLAKKVLDFHNII